MKTLKIVLISAALTTSVSVTQQVFAKDPVSANVALTTNYIFRGVTQNNEDPALQGGFDYEHTSGFYAGVWGSNVDFGGDESTEIDFYAGYGFELGSVALDFGVISYKFFGGDAASDSDIEEIYAGISYAGFGLTYSAGLDDAEDNIELSYDVDFSGFTLGLAYGDYENVSDEYYSASLSKEAFGLGFDLTVADADATDDTQIAFTISKSF